MQAWEVLVKALMAVGLVAFGYWSLRQKLRQMDEPFDGGASLRERTERVAPAVRGAGWAEAAKALGLTYAEGEAHTLTGELDGMDVRLEAGNAARGAARTRAVIGARGRICPDVTLEPEAPFLELRKRMGKDDLQVGEPAFDDAVHLAGPEASVLATLRVGVRRALIEEEGLSVRNGELHVEWKRELVGAAALESAVRWAVQLAKKVGVDSVPAALLGNATSDPNPLLRAKNVKALCESFAGTAEATEALAACLGDPDPFVRLVAARCSNGGEVAEEALEKLLLDEGVSESVRAAALTEMARAFPYEQVSPFVERVLAQGIRSLEVHRAAVRAAGDHRDAALLDQLLALRWTEDEALGEALAQALSSIGGEAAEGGLVALLSHASPQVRVQAAVGLGKSGSVMVVERLLQVVEGGDGRLKEAAREAVRAIQARLGDAAGGRLSVVDSRAGEGGLSVDEPASRRERG